LYFVVHYVILVILDRALSNQFLTIQGELTVLDTTEVLGVIVLGALLGAMFAYALLGGFQ